MNYYKSPDWACLRVGRTEQGGIHFSVRLPTSLKPQTDTGQFPASSR
jgi:hypothetical protein